VARQRLRPNSTQRKSISDVGGNRITNAQQQIILKMINEQKLIADSSSPNIGNTTVTGSTVNLKVLNLYAGIGGNRKLWSNVDVTSVEYNEEIAMIYKDHYPGDTVVVGDAHKYLLEHYKEFDFIWASPPCLSHSKVRHMASKAGDYDPIFPDMTLW
jgi:hypothetical protein